MGNTLKGVSKFTGTGLHVASVASNAEKIGSAINNYLVTERIGNHSPIFGLNGNFLGLDGQGFYGSAIVMDKKYFSMGMSHNIALKKDIGLANLRNTNARLKIAVFLSTMKDRFDYDGYLAVKEAYRHFNQGKGIALYVDASKIDLGNLSVSDFKDKKSKSIDFFPYHKKIKHPVNSTGFVYGHIQVTLLNAKTGKVRLGLSPKNLQKMNYPPMTLDRFDFKKKRNRKIADWSYSGEPIPYFIIMYNNITYIPIN